MLTMKQAVLITDSVLSFAEVSQGNVTVSKEGHIHIYWVAQPAVGPLSALDVFSTLPLCFRSDIDNRIYWLHIVQPDFRPYLKNIIRQHMLKFRKTCIYLT